MTEQIDRVNFWVSQNHGAGAVDVLKRLLNDGECLDVIDSELVIIDGAGGSQTAAQKFPDMADIISKNNISTALRMQLAGITPHFAQPPPKYQAEQTLDVQSALAKYYLLSKASAPNG